MSRPRGLSLRLYALLLRLYPLRFRRRYGDEMLHDFEQLLRSDSGFQRAWRRVISDLFRDASTRRWRHACRRAAEAATDVGFAGRRLRKDVTFSIPVVGTLALALAIGGGVFAFARAILWQPVRAMPEADRVFAVYAAREERLGNLSFPDFGDIVAADIFDSTAAAVRSIAHFGAGDSMTRLPVALVSAQFFDVMGVQPSRGAVWDSDADDTRVLVVSDELARSGSGHAVGSTVRVNGFEYRVVGVTPPDFGGPWINTRPRAWLPVEAIGDLMGFMGSPVDGSGRRILGYRGYMTFEVFGRLGRDTTPAQLEQRLDALSTRLLERFPDYGLEMTSRPARQAAFDPRNRPEMTRYTATLGASAALVLLVVLGNLGNLAGARALARGRELAIRAAVGAGRGRLVRLVLWENLLVVTLALLVAAGLARAAGAGLSGLSLPGGVAPEVRIDWLVLGVMAAMALVSTLVLVGASLGPALGAGEAVRPGSASPGGDRRAGRASTFSVVAQVAMSLMLLSTAGLLSRTLFNLDRVDPGFDSTGVVLATIDADSLGYDETRGRRLHQALRQRLRLAPGVLAVGAGSDVPLDPVPGWNQLAAPGIEPARLEGLAQTIVAPGFFEVLGVPVVAGRVFLESDDVSSARVVVVNDSLARQLWPGESAVGKQLGHSAEGPWFEVIGVVRSYHHESLRRRPTPRAYWSQQQVYSWAKGPTQRTLMVRTDLDPMASVRLIQSVARQVDPNLALGGVSTLAARTSLATVQERQTAWLIGLAALFAVTVTSVGLFGLLAFQVRQRFHEIGVRMAVGAGAGDVRRMVLLRGARLAAAGVIIGLLGSLGTARLVASMLFGVTAGDPLSLVTVAAVMLGVAAAASYLPARAASRVDPVRVLNRD